MKKINAILVVFMLLFQGLIPSAFAVEPPAAENANQTLLRLVLLGGQKDELRPCG